MLVSAKFEYQRGLLSRLADWFFGPYTPLTLTSGEEAKSSLAWESFAANKMYPEKSEGETSIPLVSRGAMTQATSYRGRLRQPSAPPPQSPSSLRVTFISANISRDSYCLKMHSMDHALGPPGMQSTLPSS